MGRPDYIFGQFRETARCRDAQHGAGFVVLSHHSLLLLLLILILILVVNLSLFGSLSPVFGAADRETDLMRFDDHFSRCRFCSTAELIVLTHSFVFIDDIVVVVLGTRRFVRVVGVVEGKHFVAGPRHRVTIR